MMCYAEQQNLIQSTEGISGVSPFCIATSVGFFIGDRMKVCTKCHQEKDLLEFYKYAKPRIGYRPKCKTCHLEYGKKYNRTEQGKKARRKFCRRYHKTEKYKMYMKRYRQTEKSKSFHKIGNKRYNLQYPKKMKATNAVNNAIRASKIPHIKTRRCYFCFEQAEQYHHYKGYERKFWLDVIPICKKCHRKCHLKKAV